MFRLITFIAALVPTAIYSAELADLKTAVAQSMATYGATTTAAATITTDGPPLLIKVADNYECPPGEKAELEILAHLIEKKWRANKHYAIQRSDVGPCPQFFWQGKQFATDGYTNLADWVDALYAAMGVPSPEAPQVASANTPPVKATGATGYIPVGSYKVTAVNGVPVDGPIVYEGNAAASTEYTPAPIQSTRRAIPPARQRWYQNGGSVTDSHLRSHGIDPSGMSQAEKDRAHSHAHEGTWNPAWLGMQSLPTYSEYQPQPTYYRPARSVQRACPTCPR